MLNLDNLPKNGTVVEYNCRGALVKMTITSTRVRYGQIDVQLTPVEGSGSFWVTESSVIKSAEEVITAL